MLREVRLGGRRCSAYARGYALTIRDGYLGCRPMSEQQSRLGLSGSAEGGHAQEKPIAASTPLFMQYQYTLGDGPLCDGHLIIR